LRKNQIQYQIDKILYKSLQRGNTTHTMNWFCKDELGSNFNMVPEFVEFKGHLPINAQASDR